MAIPSQMQGERLENVAAGQKRRREGSDSGLLDDLGAAGMRLESRRW